MNKDGKEALLQSDIETLRRVIRSCEPVYKQAFENIITELNEAREALGNSIMLPSYDESSAPQPAAPDAPPPNLERYRLDLARELFLNADITSDAVQKHAEACASSANLFMQAMAKLDKLPH